MGNVPKLDAESTIWAGSPSSSWSSMNPSSMYWRSQANASSSSAPAKHERGSISAISDRDVTSSRFSVRLK